MTTAEKILAAKSRRSSVAPSEIVEAYPDLVGDLVTTDAAGDVAGGLSILVDCSAA